MVIFVVAFLLGFHQPAFAGADPDEHRRVGEGREAFLVDNVQVGGTYEAFLIGFPDRPGYYLSPSRYRVSYIPNALQCRNESDFAFEEARNGHWWTVVFEVFAVKETAIEDPPGSGKWSWRHSYDCSLKKLDPAK